MRSIVFVICILPMIVGPSHAQVIGNIMPDNFGENLATGSIETGFGFAGLRYEDKQRMKRLRERYLELNPKNKGIVEVYDVDGYADDNADDNAEDSETSETAPATSAQAPAAEAE